MPSRAKHLCVFGDSHFACAKSAFDHGLVASDGIDIEFWGNIGKQFRHLTWRNDRVEPMDEFTAGRFAATNSQGRTVLDARDFDMILFQGCRIDLYRVFPELLHRRRTPTARLSPAVERRYLRDFLLRLPPYHFARNFAAQGAARIVMAPTSFNTEGFDRTVSDRYAAAADATPEDRAAIWVVVSEIMQEDGITLLAQPESTVVAGCCTHTDYAVKDHVARGDKTHKNAEFGAIILNTAIEMLKRTASPKTSTPYAKPKTPAGSAAKTTTARRVPVSRAKSVKL